MTVRDWICVCLMAAGVLLFVVGWFVPKRTNLEPELVVLCFGVVGALIFVTGAYNLDL